MDFDHMIKVPFTWKQRISVAYDASCGPAGTLGVCLLFFSKKVPLKIGFNDCCWRSELTLELVVLKIKNRCLHNTWDTFIFHLIILNSCSGLISVLNWHPTPTWSGSDDQVCRTCTTPPQRPVLQCRTQVNSVNSDRNDSGLRLCTLCDNTLLLFLSHYCILCMIYLYDHASWLPDLCI